MSQLPTIAITAGEPAGIGPDLVLGALPQQVANWVVIADPDMLRERAAQMGIQRNIVTWSSTPAAASDDLRVLPVSTARQVVAGTLDSANAGYVLDTIRLAVEGCQSATFDAMVTAPVHKGVINDAGISFSGHTEYIAEKVAATPLMMLATEHLRVALVTTHLPLSQVARAISRETVLQTLTLLHHELQAQFGIDDPHILVCGLNPHAGESGHLGREEIEQIEPALKLARQAGINATGPLPADTLFTPKYLDNADAVLAMYHDQGLPVLKFAGFGEAVNITLGLPIIRTSVDHGTALDLAATGSASGGSLQAACRLAAHLAGQRLGRA